VVVVMGAPPTAVARLNVLPVELTTKYTVPTDRPPGNAPVVVKAMPVPFAIEYPVGNVTTPGAAILMVD
jgi:hypothetical protein